MYLVILNFKSNSTDVMLYSDIDDVDNEDFELDIWLSDHYNMDDIQYMVCDYINIRL